MASLDRCKKCFQEIGRQWTDYAGAEVHEGLCPKKDGETNICEKTGEEIFIPCKQCK